jgi:dipeptidyl aminopeptidase/acylaminoacyl peptidase
LISRRRPDNLRLYPGSGRMVRWGLALAAIVVLAAGAARAAPLEAYGKLPSIEEMTISPDGTRLASIRTNGEQRTIRIETLADHKVQRLLQVGDAKLRGLEWAGPDHLIILRSSTSQVTGVGIVSDRGEFLFAIDYNLTTGVARPLLTDAGGALNTLLEAPAVRMVNGKPVLFVLGEHMVDSMGHASLYRIELDHDTSTLVEDGRPETNDWVMGSGDGAVGQSLWNATTGRWSMKIKMGDTWKEVRVETALNETPVLAGLGRDGRSVLVEELSAGKSLVRELSLDGAWGAPLDIVEGERLIFDPVTQKLIGHAALAGDETQYVFFDPQDQAVWDLVRKAYPNQRVELVSWSDDRKKIVVMADSPTEGPGYALIDLAARHADWLDNRYDKLGPDDIGPVRPVRFKARDGLQLSGYLTLPKGAAPKNLPLVVFPHGGPAARDEPGFDWWAQAMASRGYAVLQVNYRGSDGLGWDFLQAGFGQWGRKMQTDLSDGVRYLAGEGIVDPKRVCIVGASYGGYAALAGAALDPGVYRCAVSYAGPSHMGRMVSWSRDRHGIASERYWLRFMGGEKASDAALAQISPALHADKVQAPVLLLHGKDDTVVPLEQSYMMSEALKAAGKPVEFQVFNGTDHWLLRGETRLAMLKATVAFLEKNNPPN